MVTVASIFPKIVRKFWEHFLIFSDLSLRSQKIILSAIFAKNSWKFSPNDRPQTHLI